MTTPVDMERFDRLPPEVRRALSATVMNIGNLDVIEKACREMSPSFVAMNIRQFDAEYVRKTTVLK